MTKPNFKSMSKKELRAYVLAHRDDDDAFYAYADKTYEENAALNAAVIEWLQHQYPQVAIAKVPETSSKFIMTDSNNHQKLIRIQMMTASLPTQKLFIEHLITDINKDKYLDKVSIVTIFVSKNESKAIDLQREIEEVKFSDRTNSAQIVGYLEESGNFRNI
ncbi:hypothetical protein H6S82_14735 [Planktothrix sp. FACHB-1355]|uniref:Uncharacterized protein n=1 Tax=Aerosakkonema funiforme FACHB-1375 TaxID=2949571 RepID=A0A926VED2_9CYAN|nr:MULTISPECIES: hypothetical protein [Oscillatoriales]MBD2182177.1 hypothetical protein [Aerosakkonema funiforme FACHB-1375]MBD3560104.1 hypothetical protein [Planktothrix sp. FACHB-1355]